MDNSSLWIPSCFLKSNNITFYIDIYELYAIYEWLLVIFLHYSYCMLCLSILFIKKTLAKMNDLFHWYCFFLLFAIIMTYSLSNSIQIQFFILLLTKQPSIKIHHHPIQNHILNLLIVYTNKQLIPLSWLV